MPQINRPYASGTQISWDRVGTSLSTMFSSLSSYLPFTSKTEPPIEGVYTDFLADSYIGAFTAGLKGQVSGDRLATIAAKDPSGQSGDCAWYNVPCKVANRVSSVTASAGEFVSSTLYKTLAIVVVVGVGTLFLLSYVQAKGGQLAK